MTPFAWFAWPAAAIARVIILVLLSTVLPQQLLRADGDVIASSFGVYGDSPSGGLQREGRLPEYGDDVDEPEAGGRWSMRRLAADRARGRRRGRPSGGGGTGRNLVQRLDRYRKNWIDYAKNFVWSKFGRGGGRTATRVPRTRRPPATPEPALPGWLFDVLEERGVVLVDGAWRNVTTPDPLRLYYYRERGYPSLRKKYKQRQTRKPRGGGGCN